MAGDGGKRISYVLATRNRASFLETAIANVREFIGPEDELIVVDGQSTDATASVVARNRDVVSIFISEPDRGEAHAINKGLLASNGTWIKFLSDDDYHYPDAVRAAIGILESVADIDALICGGEAVAHEPNAAYAKHVLYEFLPTGIQLSSDPRVFMKYVPCGMGLFLKRRGLALVGLLDPSFLAVDTDFLARVVTSGMSVRYLDVKLYRHVEYAHSGQKNVDACYRDNVRVLVRHGQWSTGVGGYSPAVIATALGLDRIERGNQTARILRHLEQLRTTRIARLVVVVEAFLTMALSVYAWLASAWQVIRDLARPGARARGRGVSAEPTWDGSLR